MKDNYPTGKSDLFAAFIERCSKLAALQGAVAMITMQSWMFLSSYEKLRTLLLTKQRISSMLHLGARAFDSIGGEVVSSTAFVQVNTPAGGSSQTQKPAGTFIRLVDGASEAAKIVALNTALESRTREAGFHTASHADFSAIPGSPIVYWLSEKMRATFESGLPLAEVANLCQGLATTNNGRFTRFWWEVPKLQIAFSCETRSEAELSGARWFPYNKGGAFRRWYGNQELVVNWQADGREIKEEIARKYPYLNGNVDWVAKNQSSYFSPSVSWSKISSGAPAFRFYPPGFIYDVAGTSIFTMTDEDRFRILSFTNSQVALEQLAALAPTLNYEVGQVASLPLTERKSDDTPQLASSAFAEAKADWDSSETSWDFTSNPLVAQYRSDVGSE